MLGKAILLLLITDNSVDTCLASNGGNKLKLAWSSILLIVANRKLGNGIE